MNNIPDFTTTDIQIIVAIIAGLVGIGLGIYHFIQSQKDRRIKILAEKVKGNDHRIRQIRVRYMNKPIEKCNISFKGTKLVWDSTDGQTNFTIVEGSARNATIPDDIFSEDAEVVVRTGNKVIKRVNFKDMDLAQ